MIFDYFAELNWLAVVVAALAYFALGAIWYSNALFGKQYRAAIGQTEPGVVDPAGLIVNAVGWFVAAVALGLMTEGIGATTAWEGILLGVVVWVGFIVTNRVVANTYEGRGWALAWINGPYNLLGFALMGLILAVWE